MMKLLSGSKRSDKIPMVGEISSEFNNLRVDWEDEDMRNFFAELLSVVGAAIGSVLMICLISWLVWLVWHLLVS